MSSSPENPGGPLASTPDERRPKRTGNEIARGVSAFIRRHLAVFVALGLLGAAGGLAWWRVRDAAFVATALVEIGQRPTIERGILIEPPTIASRRMHALLMKYAREYDPEASADVSLRKDAEQKPTGYLDVSLRTKTATAARAIMTNALRDYVEEHRKTRQFEREAAEREVAYYQAAADRLSRGIMPGDEDEKALRAALLEARRQVNSDAIALSEARTPPTRVVFQDPKASQAAVRAASDALVGLFTGLLLAVLLILAKGYAERDAADSIIRGFVSFTWRHWKLIFLTALVGIAGGILERFTRPVQHAGRAVLIAATIPNEGTFEPSEVTAERLQRFVDDQRENEVLSPDVSASVTAIPIDTQTREPQTKEPANLLEVVVKADTAESVEKCIDLTAKALIDVQRPLLLQEKERYERHGRALEADLERNRNEPLTADGYTAFVNITRELIDTKLLGSPGRLYEPALLGRGPVRKYSTGRSLASHVGAGLIAGLIAGYLAAFVAAGARLARGRSGGVQVGSGSPIT